MFFRASCDFGNSSGCVVLGANYEAGTGLRLSYPTAKEYYGKACDLGNQEGCKNYARLKKLGY